MTDFLKAAIDQAKISVEKGGFPAGAVVVKDDQILSTGTSLGFSLHDPTSHAETQAIRDACKKLSTIDLTGAVLYESVECCVMCFSVAYWAGISKIVYAVKKTDEMVKKGYYEGNTDNNVLNDQNNRQIELVFDQSHEKGALEVIQDWEEQGGFNKK